VCHSVFFYIKLCACLSQNLAVHAMPPRTSTGPQKLGAVPAKSKKGPDPGRGEATQKAATTPRKAAKTLKRSNTGISREDGCALAGSNSSEAANTTTAPALSTSPVGHESTIDDSVGGAGKVDKEHTEHTEPAQPVVATTPATDYSDTGTGTIITEGDLSLETPRTANPEAATRSATDGLERKLDELTADAGTPAADTPAQHSAPGVSRAFTYDL
jgi:hypothetical protein